MYISLWRTEMTTGKDQITGEWTGGLESPWKRRGLHVLWTAALCKETVGQSTMGWSIER